MGELKKMRAQDKGTKIDIAVQRRTPAAPIIYNVDDPAQRAAMEFFLKNICCRNTVAASAEARRLRPYFAALAAVTREDIRHQSRGKMRWKKKISAQDVFPAKFEKLFNTVAQKTGNTVLSEMAILPISFGSLQGAGLAGKDVKVFGDELLYGGYSYCFGFMQVFEHGINQMQKSSTAIPFFAFDSGLLRWIEPYEPRKMLESFQTVMSYGNHDMMHHFTNTILNTDIAQTFKNGNKARYKNWDETGNVSNWDQRNFTHFGEQEPGSYESWLIMNHARVRKSMEGGEEYQKMRTAMIVFFDELKRIGEQAAENLAKEGAERGCGPEWVSGRKHNIVDYFGTMMLYAMMRFMPLFHPLFNEAISRLKDADPDPAFSQTLRDARKQQMKQRIAMDWQYERRLYLTLMNYRKAGAGLLKGGLDHYENLKKMEVASVASWTARLLSPPNEDKALTDCQHRVAATNVDMVQASAHTVDFRL